MSMLKSIKVLKFLIIVISLCVFSGCIYKAVGESIANTMKESMTDVMPVITNTQVFCVKNGHWPQSYDQLRFFCSDPNNECLKTAWEHITAEFQQLPDGRLHSTYHLHNVSDPCAIISFETTMNIPEPNKSSGCL
jgi:hypothetical protein